MPDETNTLAEQFDLPGLIVGLVADLKDLRAGKISTRDAQARALLAKHILRGVYYLVQAQKFLEGRALPAPESSEAPKPRKGSRKSKTIDA